MTDGQTNLTRRNFLYGLGATATLHHVLGQGVASRGVRPQKKGKPSGQPFLAQFKDVSEAAGLHFPCIYGGKGSKEWILETMGCGCAFIDYDNDGWMDIFVLSGQQVLGTPHGTSNRLYKNNRDGSFTDVTEKAGLLKMGWASAVCVADYNNDGFDDIFITYWGQNVLYRNNGNGTFTDVTREAGLGESHSRWGSGCSFIDYDRDGNLDLFVANYVQFDFATTPRPGSGRNCNWKGIPVNCGPRGLPAGTQSLYHNNGDGTFSDVSKAAGITNKSACYGLSVLTGDMDDDGWPDIYVACDSTASLLYMNNHDGTFREEAVDRGVAYSSDGMEQGGMGVASGDYDTDGKLDIIKTHFADDTNVLWRNLGKGEFEDVTLAAGLGVETRFVCWGTGIVDLDNNGLPDLVVVTGNVYPEVEQADRAYPFKTPRIIFRNLGRGKFEELIEEAGPGIAEPHSSRGCAFGDYDNDGDMDILVVNLNEPPSLLRNDLKGANHWIKVKLIGTKSNRSAIGGRVTVRYGSRIQVQEVVSQSGYFSASDPRLHFGLGEAKTLELEIRWPTGLTERVKPLEVDRLVTIKEGEGIVPNLGWSKDVL